MIDDEQRETNGQTGGWTEATKCITKYLRVLL